MKSKTMLGLLLAVLALTAGSCGSEKSPEKQTQNTEPTDTVETEEPAKKEVTVRDKFDESVNFGGKEIRYIVERQNSEPIDTIWQEKDSGDIVNSAVFHRNLAVCEALGVNIKIAKEIDYRQMVSALQTAVQAGDAEYEIASVKQCYSCSAAAMNLLYPMDELTDLDFDAGYWPTSYIREMSYNGTYWATGDMATLYTGSAMCVYVNTVLFGSLYDGESVYDLVKAGKWTYDRMNTYVSGAYHDLNGSSDADPDDQYGLALEYADPLFPSAGLVYCTRDGDGVPVLALNSERTVEIYDKLYGILNENPAVLFSDAIDSLEMFGEGRTLFACKQLSAAGGSLRESETDFAIYPMPKFNEEQESYISYAADSIPLYGILSNAEDPDMCAAFLEAMAIESYRTLRPAYYEMALKEKYTREKDSAEMIDLIHDTVTTDFGFVYSECIGGGIGTTGSGIHRLIRNGMANQQKKFASLYAAEEKRFDNYMSKLIKAFDEQA